VERTNTWWKPIKLILFIGLIVPVKFASLISNEIFNWTGSVWFATLLFFEELNGLKVDKKSSLHLQGAFFVIIVCVFISC